MAERIYYRGRVRGWKLPDDAVYVGRHTSTSYGRWGNPFDVTGAIEAGYADTEADAQALCVEMHRRWLAGDVNIPDIVHLGDKVYDRRVVLDELPQLAGKDLACWCRPGIPCHADTLLALANGDPR